MMNKNLQTPKLIYNTKDNLLEDKKNKIYKKGDYYYERKYKNFSS